MLLLPQRVFFFFSLLLKQICARQCKRLTAVWAKSWTTKLSSWNNDDIAPLRRWMRSVYASYLKLWHIKLLMWAAQRKSKQWFLARNWCWMDTNWFSSMLSEPPVVQPFFKMVPHIYNSWKLEKQLCLLTAWKLNFRTWISILKI